jgi:hypothetical protein
MTVWLLKSGDFTYGVFSTPAKATAWLRKSRRFMWEEERGGTIIPTQEGACLRLNECFLLVPFDVDPEPISEPDPSPRAVTWVAWQ